MSRITELKVDNYKRLKAIHLKPTGEPLYVIGGRNSQGKTSVLDALAAVFGGAKLSAAQPIRKGENFAEITAKLAETEHGDITVKVRWDHKGRQLVITSADGYEAPTPQALLNDMVGALTFDPLEFTRQKPADQQATLRQLVGLDTTAIDDQRARSYVTRTGVNRRVKELDAKLAGMATPDNVPPALASVTEVARELEAAREANRANQKRRDGLDATRKGIEYRQSDLDALQVKIAELVWQARELGETIAADTLAYQRAAESVAQLADVATGEIEARLETVEADNERYRAEQSRLAVAQELSAARDEAHRLTQEIDQLDADKEAATAAITFPVEGLGFGENGVLYNGVPFEQASTSDRIRVSAAMGFELNPELRIMLMREGAFLDGDGLAILEGIAAHYNGQIWLERVGDGSEVAVVIEDGSVKEVREPKPRKAKAEPATASDAASE